MHWTRRTQPDSLAGFNWRAAQWTRPDGRASSSRKREVVVPGPGARGDGAPDQAEERAAGGKAAARRRQGGGGGRAAHSRAARKALPRFQIRARRAAAGSAGRWADEEDEDGDDEDEDEDEVSDSEGEGEEEEGEEEGEGEDEAGGASYGSGARPSSQRPPVALLVELLVDQRWVP